MDTIRYNGYDGSIEVSEDDNLFFGKVLGIKSLISYEGKTPEEFLSNFHGAIDNYLGTCKKEGKEPEVPNKGSYKTSRFKNMLEILFLCFVTGVFFIGFGTTIFLIINLILRLIVGV